MPRASVLLGVRLLAWRMRAVLVVTGLLLAAGAVARQAAPPTPPVEPVVVAAHDLTAGRQQQPGHDQDGPHPPGQQPDTEQDGSARHPVTVGTASGSRRKARPPWGRGRRRVRRWIRAGVWGQACEV